MTSDIPDPSVLNRGALLALDRDEAKQLFGARGDDALREFLNEVVSRPLLWQEGRVVDCQERWQEIHRCLEQQEGDEPLPLEQCLLGGRPMFHAEEMTVCMVRPDMVSHLAGALRSLDELRIRNSLSLLSPDLDVEQIMPTFNKIQTLYRSAAENRQAVVFAVSH